ncbi:MAG: hypothetical protein QF371_07720, partial [Flavobacteriales bacterium]|nr:hypothetical protein [Flavobacteriales bacterium]
LVFDDYGLSWDEDFQHHYGKVVYEYVFEDDQTMHVHNSRYHGPVFQFILYAAEKLFRITELNEIYKLRHLLTFAFSLIGCCFFYRLLLLFRFPPFWAALGLLFLICSPRIFAHSFYNSKDATFMYFFIIGIYTMIRFLRKPNWRNALWHALVCALIIDVRILGFFVPLLTGILWLLETAQNRQYLKESWQPMIAFGLATLLIAIAFWPTLWHAPLEEFQNAITKMSAYPWDDPVLFEGVFRVPKDLPWYYLPKWMVITTPIFILLMLILGLIPWILSIRNNLVEKCIPLLWVLLPFGLILWKSATVYDGWRHVYFLYPALLIVALFGAETIFVKWLKHAGAKWIPVIFLLNPMLFMVKAHPNQQVYFNQMAKTGAWKNYEMDYWGSSYRHVLETLIDSVPNGSIRIARANQAGYYNRLMLRVKDRKRLHYTDPDSADYFVSNFRFPDEHAAFARKDGLYSNPMEIIYVDGNPIVGLYKVKKH